MPRADRGLIAHEPLAADGKAAQPRDLRESGRLQQRQTAAPRANEHESRSLFAHFPRSDAAQSKLPLAVAASQPRHLPTGRDTTVLLQREPAAESACEQTVVDLRAITHRRRHRAGFAAFHHKRRPVLNDGCVGGELHAAKEMMLLHRRVPSLQEVDIVSPLHKAEMRNRVNEACRVAHHACGGHRSPELLRLLKLFEDAQCPRNRNVTIGIASRGVAHLTHTGVPGPRVVPAVRGFPRELGRHLDHLNSKSRIKPLEHHRHCRRHDPASDQHDVGSVNNASHDTAGFSNCRLGAACGPSVRVRIRRLSERGIGQVGDSGIHPLPSE